MSLRTVTLEKLMWINFIQSSSINNNEIIFFEVLWKSLRLIPLKLHLFFSLIRRNYYSDISGSSIARLDKICVKFCHAENWDANNFSDDLERRESFRLTHLAIICPPVSVSPALSKTRKSSLRAMSPRRSPDSVL